jgi:hypothetical protein
MGHLEFEDEYGESPAEIVAENEITAEQKFCLHNDTMFIKSCCEVEPETIEDFNVNEADSLFCITCQSKFTLIEVCNTCGLETEIDS